MHRVFCLTLAIVLGMAIDGWCAFGSIGKDQVNVRSGPGLKYQVMFQAPMGYPVEIVKKQQDWVQVRDWEGHTGWVKNSMLSNIRTTVVLPERANVRDNPSTGGGIVRKVEKGDIFKVIAVKKNWLRIGYYYDDEPVGWIRQDLVFGN